MIFLFFVENLLILEFYIKKYSKSLIKKGEKNGSIMAMPHLFRQEMNLLVYIEEQILMREVLIEMIMRFRKKIMRN